MPSSWVASSPYTERLGKLLKYIQGHRFIQIKIKIFIAKKKYYKIGQFEYYTYKEALNSNMLFKN